MIRPWIAYSPRYPHAYQRVRARIEMLRDDFPESRLRVISSTTARLVHTACRHLGVAESRYGVNRLRERGQRLVAFWDFRDDGVAQVIRLCLDRIPVEVYDADFEGAGARAREVLGG